MSKLKPFFLSIILCLPHLLVGMRHLTETDIAELTNTVKGYMLLKSTQKNFHHRMHPYLPQEEVGEEVVYQLFYTSNKRPSFCSQCSNKRYQHK